MRSHQKRIAALRRFMPPDASKHISDPAYAKALIAATGLTRTETAAKLGIGTSTLRAYTNSVEPTPVPYPVQYALENLVVTSKEQTNDKAHQPSQDQAVRQADEAGQVAPRKA